jgi:hypothetical protein
MDEASDAATERPPRLEEVFQPWELNNESRRDCEPHRAGFLRWMARISLILGSLSFLCPLLGLIGLPLALVIRVLARRDLDAIFAGAMDHHGREGTEMAWRDSHAGALLSLLSFLFPGFLWVATFLLSRSFRFL